MDGEIYLKFCIDIHKCLQVFIKSYCNKFKIVIIFFFFLDMYGDQIMDKKIS